jgi:anthranilate synthase/aminodeoxychorismate synthase-like glutamine amidotransferase
MKVLVLDNFDSFTFNLVDYFRSLGSEVTVVRNTTSMGRLRGEVFDLLVLSPGPALPKDSGNLMQVIDYYHCQKPILGVCLGHQAIAEYFGGVLENIQPMHGKAVEIQHDGKGIFSGMEQGIEVARYHSWAVSNVPQEMEVSAVSSDGVVMGIRHQRWPIEGVQFHPESVLTMRNDAGIRMIQNVVEGKLGWGGVI